MPGLYIQQDSDQLMETLMNSLRLQFLLLFIAGLRKHGKHDFCSVSKSLLGLTHTLEIWFSRKYQNLEDLNGLFSFLKNK